jgi:glycosyltransferase involved in cell wall biosynthesis
MTTDASGGAEFAATVMLDALCERGHQAIVLTNRPGMAEATRVEERAVRLGPKLSQRSRLRLALSWPLHLRALRRALEELAPYDVLLVHFKKEQLLAALLPKRLRAGLVWAEWGPVPYPLRRGVPRRIYAAAARRARAVMAVSEGTRRTVVDAGVPAAKVVVVPNVLRGDEIGFDEAGGRRVRSELGIGDGEFVIGCISRFHPKKRNDVLVEAVGRLDRDARLIMAGEGETQASLRALAERLGVQARFLPTPRGEVAALLSAFDVSVFCPSPTEGAPRAVIIAMLAERPTVATGPEGVEDLIEPGTGTIVAPQDDANALAATLRAYAADPERRRAEGRRARERALARFDAPVVAAQVERVFRDAAAPPALT